MLTNWPPGLGTDEAANRNNRRRDSGDLPTVLDVFRFWVQPPAVPRKKGVADVATEQAQDRKEHLRHPLEILVSVWANVRLPKLAHGFDDSWMLSGESALWGNRWVPNVLTETLAEWGSVGVRVAMSAGYLPAVFSKTKSVTNAWWQERLTKVGCAMETCRFCLTLMTDQIPLKHDRNCPHGKLRCNRCGHFVWYTSEHWEMTCPCRDEGEIPDVSTDH